MAKVVKNKRNIRLKKRIRKTFGTLFLVSALAVAAIPADSLQAQNDTPRVTLEETESNIPIVDSSETIYTTGDGTLQFAYYKPTPNSQNKVAIILGYNSSYLPVGGSFTIPDTVDAYLKYSDSLGSEFGYVAVGKDKNFLFYENRVQKKDENGNPVTEKIPNPDVEGEFLDQPVMVSEYLPCAYEAYARWKDLKPEQFYYLVNGGTAVSSGDASEYALTVSPSKQRIQAADVVYIGNQYLESLDDGTWRIVGKVTSGDQGVFAGGKNIKILTVGPKLSGIGNYAFYGCTNLNGIKLSNGLDTIGNYAFASCINLVNVDLDVGSKIGVIGDHAFYDCRGLASFRMPNSVKKVGDSAFEGCSALQSVILTNKTESTGEGANVDLSELGDKVFKNCASLQNLILPPNYQGTLNIGMVKGCSSLKYITVPNSTITFAPEFEDDGEKYTLAKFKDSVSTEFYFEGRSGSALHKTATEGSFAFRYLNQDIYEKIVIDEDGKKAIYQVNKDNELIYCVVDPGMKNVLIPDTIGPYKVTSIGASSFEDNCSLQKIEIPSSVTSIGENAFKGCHNLKHVIFKEPVKLESIGINAFQTQQVGLHKSDCTNKILDKMPMLTFTGPVAYGSVPFDYAMDVDSKINVGDQPPTYITYYSGWPENLTVQYNHETYKNELIDYPTFSGLGNYTTASYPYMTTDFATAARDAKTKYLAGDTLKDNEIDIINSALNIVLPKGIESIKAGLFKDNEEAESADMGGVDNPKVRKIITTYGINEIAPNSFEGAKYLQEINILGDNTTSVGDYAFKDCINLTKAVISPKVSSLGVRPFAGCGLISNVDFQGSPFYTCDNSIIFEKTNDKNTKVIECLESRGNISGSGTIQASELAGVSEIVEEAFMGCSGIGSVDFRSTTIKVIPKSAFENTKTLNAVYLPTTCNSIDAHAFKDSRLGLIEIPRQVGYIDPDAFNHEGNSKVGEYFKITFVCEDDSNASIYAGKHSNIDTTPLPPPAVEYTVYFWDFYGKLLERVPVLAGDDAVAPEPPIVEGYIFEKWIGDFTAVSRDMDVTPKYNPVDPDASKFKVTFYDDNNNMITFVLVSPGGNADAPADPVKEGYNFKGWNPPITNIQEDTKVYPKFDKIDSEDTKFTIRFIDFDDKVLYTQDVSPGKDAIEPKSPVREGYNFVRWRPAITGVTKSFDAFAEYEKKDGTGTDGSDGSGSVTTKFYTLTVQNGSGSGSYGAGTRPIVIANDPADGQEFSHWTVTPESVAVASKNVTATVLTMPEGDVTITAHYKEKGSVTTGSSNTSSNKVSSSNGGSNNTVSKQGGTTVVIDKNGLSNTGVITAKVNGSTDDFVIKITENANATEQIVKALMNEYGDISTITYFPMDISLYDSTGQNKITDTSGLSISITLPIPDDMITYAGNNKIAGVVDEKLDKLTPKFSTISGVSCMTFTATHFSPYVIYVDTANLTAGVVTDTTPRTGDGIHPKWFLSIGLASMSVVLFLKKDKNGKVKAVVA